MKTLKDRVVSKLTQRILRKCIQIFTVLLISGSTIVNSLPAIAMDKTYFRTLDGEKFACDRANLKYHLDATGKLAAICERIPELNGQDGETPETAFELDINGRLAKEYILDLILDGQTTFKNKADAENTLRICEDLGLPEIEKFICNSLGPKWKPKRELIAQGQPLISQTRARNQNCPAGYVLVAGNPEYSTPTPSEDFCVMKYAASNDGNGAAVSRLGLTPWVNGTELAHTVLHDFFPSLRSG